MLTQFTGGRMSDWMGSSETQGEFGENKKTPKRC